jgi:predicted nucleotidyltransferase
MQPNPTPYADVNQLLEQLLSSLQTILGKKLVGLYLYGSLVTGDFDHECSDIDLLAAAHIPIFAISTFDTDYILIKEENVVRARLILEEHGHVFV